MTKNNKWVVLSSTSLAVLLVTLNGGTLIIALPVLLKELHTSLVSILWVMMIYSLTNSILLLNVGRLSDVIGRKTIYNLGFAIFTIASLLSGLAGNVEQLIIYRAIQGIGGSLLMGISMALITDAFPAEQRGTALGINSMVAAVGQMTGPIVGGFLVGIGWRWIFMFNVPIGVIATIWSYLTLHETGTKDKVQSFDLAGTSLFLIGIVSLLIVLSFGGIYGWFSVLTIVLSIVAVLATIAFIVVEKRSADPLLDLSLFKNRIFSTGNLSAFFNSMARLAVTFLLTFYFQGAKGYNAIEAGLMLIPLAASMFIFAPVSGWLSDRYQGRLLTSIGLAVSGLGLLGLAYIKIDTPYWVLAVCLGLIGGGSGLFNSPNTSSIMGVVPPQKRGVAAGTRSLVVNVGMTVSLAMALAITTSSMSKETMMMIFADQKIKDGSIALGGFIHGLHNAFWFSVILTVIAALISLMKSGHSQKDQPLKILSKVAHNSN